MISAADNVQSHSSLQGMIEAGLKKLSFGVNPASTEDCKHEEEAIQTKRCNESAELLLELQQRPAAAGIQGCTTPERLKTEHLKFLQPEMYEEILVCVFGVQSLNLNEQIKSKVRPDN